MAFPSYSFPSRSQRAGGSRPVGPVFAVGRQAFLNAPDLRTRVVPLLDTTGSVVDSLPDGTEVEILGWVPAGMATRYHVRPTEQTLSGWVGVASLRASPGRLRPGVAEKAAAPVSIPPRMPTVVRPAVGVPSPGPRKSPAPSGAKAVRKRGLARTAKKSR